MESKRKKGIDCREFMEISRRGAATIGLAPFCTLAGCADSRKTKTVFRAWYHDCPDWCSRKVTTVGNKVADFHANKNNPYTAGNLCNKMVGFPHDVTFPADRILSPTEKKRTQRSGEFSKMSWDQAISKVESI